MNFFTFGRVNAAKRVAFVSLFALSAGALAADVAQKDKEFLIRAAQAGKTEVAASKLAETKAASTEVKSFASTMVNDHGNVDNELKQLASSKGVSVPENPAKDQQAKLDKLNRLNGGKFDKEYADKIGVQAHKDAVALFKKASSDVKDPDIKAFAAKTLPALEHHLALAEALKTSIDKK